MNIYSLKYSAGKIIHLIHEKRESFWSRERERRALELFRLAASRVPAYADFLKKHKVKPEKVTTFKDFVQVPPISKQNYLREYPLEKLVWDQSLEKAIVFTATSGSTGEPFYFPRENELDWENSVLNELFVRNSSYRSEGPILVIIGFGMGVWIGGLINYKGFEMAAQRGYPLSIITPGINKIEIFNALRKLAPHYRETILAGYPPFIKDILDEAPNHGVNLKALHLRLLTAAEAYTEKFRDYLAQKAGIKNPHLDTLSIYGTADIGAMAFETPLAILIRRLVMRKKRLFEEMFSGIQKTPTLAQYNPLFAVFEAVGGELFVTGNNTIPLVRYAVGDHGGIFTFGEIKRLLKKHGIRLEEEARKAGIQNHLYELPFVYIYERKDLSTTLYGLQVYPEIIREALIEKPLNKFLTGKFTMITRYDANQNQYLEINLELRKDKRATPYVKSRASKKIVANLRLKNSEYRELFRYIKDRALPKLLFWQYEHPLHFKVGIKQKWVKK